MTRPSRQNSQPLETRENTGGSECHSEYDGDFWKDARARLIDARQSKRGQRRRTLTSQFSLLSVDAITAPIWGRSVSRVNQFPQSVDCRPSWYQQTATDDSRNLLSSFFRARSLGNLGSALLPFGCCDSSDAVRADYGNVKQWRRIVMFAHGETTTAMCGIFSFVAVLFLQTANASWW